MNAIEDDNAAMFSNEDVADEVLSDHIEIDAVNLETSPKLDKLSEEGFCCVMSLFDGVVL